MRDFTDTMKTFLLFPPHWTPAMPHLALPTLTGYLRRHGHPVTQRDLNVEVFDEIFTRQYQCHALEKIRRRYTREAHFVPDGLEPSSPADGGPPPEQIRWALDRGLRLADEVEAAKATLCSHDFYNGEVCEAAFVTLVAALELASLAHFPAHLEMTRFSGPGHSDSSRDLLRAARDPKINLFYDIFSRGVLKDILRDRPGLVGISIPTEGQFLAGLTLAALIRDSGYKCHIAVGGPHITMLREQLPVVPQLFDLFDSAVLFDGELPLLHLVEALNQGSDLAGVPNLVYRVGGKGGEIHTNPPAGLDEIRAAQLGQRPDFDGLPLDRYLTPDLVLPLATTHGCYHGKCAFCNVGYGSPFHYFPHPVAEVAAQVNGVVQKYGCRHVFFVDEALTPRTLRLLPAALAEIAGEINWAGAVRFEKALTDAILAGIARAGCRMLLFGLESASQPVMERMIKGTRPEEMSRILHSGGQAGIWNHTFFFFGFPGETMEDAQATVNFVYANQEFIHSASPGAFFLERFSPVHQNPAAYGVYNLTNAPGRDLAIGFEYQTVSGLDEAAANLLSDRFVDQLPEKRFGQYYLQDVYKFLYASELHRRGLPLPRWIE